MPAKTYDMMACGMAIIAFSGGNDDLSRLILNYDIGITMSEHDSSLLADNIKKLYLDNKLLRKYRTNARASAVRDFDIKTIENKYREIFQKFESCPSSKGVK